MSARILRTTDYRRMRWKNGGGWSTELASFPTCADDAGGTFDWRISIAEIGSDGAFSTFPGCDRLIALLEGVGMELSFDRAPSAELRERLHFVDFAGEWQTHGRLLAGPVRDFNIIARRHAVHAEVLRRPLVGPVVFLPEASTTWFVYLASGNAEVKIGDDRHTLDAGESLLLEPGAATHRVVLNGGGELLLAKFTPQSTPAQ